MKILSVHEGVVPIGSSIRNAWIDFSAMDCSIVAVVAEIPGSAFSASAMQPCMPLG